MTEYDLTKSEFGGLINALESLNDTMTCVKEGIEELLIVTYAIAEQKGVKYDTASHENR